MKTVIKTGFQSVFRNNLSTWSVLCILLTLSTFFLEYTIAFYRYLSYDTQLESADFCYTISKEDMTVADVPLKPKFDDDIVQKEKKGKKKDKKKSKK